MEVKKELRADGTEVVNIVHESEKGKGKEKKQSTSSSKE